MSELSYLHYVLECSECGNTIPLPYDVLTQAFAYPEMRAGDKEPVAAVCDRCRKVGNYDLAKKNPKPASNPVVMLADNSDWTYLGWLQCEEGACNARLPLLAKWNPIIAPEEREAYADTWIWDGLTCQNGHPIPKPHRTVRT